MVEPIYSEDNCSIYFKGNSATEFSNNGADLGGAICSYDNSYICFEGNSATEFSNNTTADNGGAYIL